MKTLHFSTAIAVCITWTSLALAVMPPGPPMTSGSGQNGMKHAGIQLSGNALSVHYDPLPPVPVTMTSGYGEDYTPAKFDVLEEKYFNAQYGWLPNGFLNLDSDQALWIERTAATTPAGATFRVYEGGNMTEGMAAWTMNEIYAADGDRWQWDAKMQHDYYTADLPGSYSMSFDIFVGDLVGNPLTQFTPTSTTFEFSVVPEPTTMALAVMGILGFVARRR